MSIPGKIPLPKIQGMDVFELEKFVSPKLSVGAKGRGVQAAKIIAKNLGKTLFAKFHQIVHRVLTGEWVTQKTVRLSIKNNIRDMSYLLGARRYESREKLDEKIEVRTWIHDSVVTLRQLCNHLKKMGIEEADELTAALRQLDDVNTKEGIKEVEDWNDYSSRHRIQLELAELIRVAYDSESTVPPKEKTPIFMLAWKLGPKERENSPLNKELTQIAEADFSNAHHLFIIDEVRRAWDIIITAFSPKDPPNDVLVQYNRVKDAVEVLSLIQKPTRFEEDVASIDTILALQTPDQFRQIYETELTNLLEKVSKKFEKETALTSRNLLIKRMTDKDYFKKDPEEIENDLREFQALLNKVHRAKGERISDSLYNRLAALHAIVDGLNALQIPSVSVPSVQPESEEPQIRIDISFPINPPDQRERLQQVLADFIQKAFEVPVPGSDPPLSFLKKNLPPALSKELESLTKDIQFRDAHNLLVVDKTRRAIEIILRGFNKHPDRDSQGMVRSLQLPLAAMNYFLSRLKNMQKTPGEVSLDDIQKIQSKETLRKGIQEGVQSVLNLEKEALNQWKVKKGWRSRPQPVLNQLQNENFLTQSSENILKSIRTLHEAVFHECRVNHHDVPDNIYDTLAALYEMAIQLDNIVKTERREATVKVPPNPEQEKQRRVIQKKLSGLIDYAYTGFQVGGRNPVSRVMQNLGGEESIKNKELRSIQLLDFAEETNLHVIDLIDHVHQYLFEAFGEGLPVQLNDVFDELDEMVDKLDNSQKGPLPPEIKPVSEIRTIENKDELRNALQESLSGFIEVLEKIGLSSPSKPIFSPMSSEGAVLSALKSNFSKVSPEKIWKTIYNLNKEVTRLCRANAGGDPPGYIYDYFSALYEMSERLIELTTPEG